MKTEHRFPRGRIVVYAKAPVPGQVKTRLARSLGRRGAAAVYRRLAGEVLATVVGAGLAPVRLEVAPGLGHPFFAAWRRGGIELGAQPGGDLGRRMQRTSRRELRRAKWVVIVGSDCAGVRVEQLHSACAALESGAQAVFVPAEDGGYALIGLRRAPALLFSGLPWGSHRVMAVTRQRLRRLGLVAVETTPGWDVDRLEDLRRLRRQGSIRPWLR